VEHGGSGCGVLVVFQLMSELIAVHHLQTGTPYGCQLCVVSDWTEWH